MKMILMSAALAGSVIWGSSAVQVNGIQSHSISEMAPLFDEEHAYETIHELSEVIGPRETGTEKEKEAASYISKRIQDEGLAVRIQPFHVKTYYSGSVMAGDHEYPIRSADKSAVENEERVEGAVLDGGYGLNLDEKEAKGKIAVMREGKISVSQKLKNAQDAGAKAVIIYNSKTKPLAIRPIKPKHITVPAAGMKKEDGEALLKEKQAVIQFKNYRNRTSQNIIGTRKAQHTKHPDILYVTAHYDTVKDAPGADDNASGTSAVLEMIEQSKYLPKNKEIRFIFFGAEELWSAGSSYYVSTLTSDEIKHSRANFNADMIATDWKDASQMYITTPDGKKNASVNYAVNAAQRAKLKAPRLTQLGYSDHVSFYEAGIPSANWIWLSPDTQEPGPWYHTEKDNIAHISKERLNEAGQLLLSAVQEANID
ncbi:M20/M25/M40 family metallo-hydrolase [Bacillus subtilis]|uniref:M20/M25/M40 family metallo-hydrolase n=1 Tax=Bacillus subtilis TaxID=1423 RepID=UPI0039F708EB